MKTFEDYEEAVKVATEEEKPALYAQWVRVYEQNMRTDGAMIVARFAASISELNCITLGLDAQHSLRISYDKDKGYCWITVDCSDRFWFACGDNEGISTEKDLNLFMKARNFFIEQNYITTDYLKKYHPTLQDYLDDDNFCFSEEDDKVAQEWLGLTYCMLVRGHEVHPYYWDQCPDWLKIKLQEAGVEPHPYRKEEVK